VLGAHRFTGSSTTSHPASSAATRASAVAQDTSSPIYTLSPAVYSYLSQALGIPISSATLSGTLSGSTLTVQAGAPANVSLPLPTGSVNLTLGSTTLSVDESTNTMTVTSSATAGATTATLTVTVNNAGTSQVTGTADVTADITVTGLTVFGAQVNLQGSLEVNGSTRSLSITGTLMSNASISSGVTLESGATVTLATGTSGDNGLSVDGTVELGSGATALPVTVKGTLSGLSDWSLTVSDASAPMWQPAPDLKVTPNFSGEIKDTAGKVTFDLSTTAPLVQWMPTANTTVVVKNLEVSNETPPAVVSCPSLSGDTLWVDASGTVTYTPPDGSSPLSLAAEACIAPSAESSTLTTSATGTLAAPAGSNVTLSNVALDVTGDFSTNTFAVDGSATLAGVGSGSALTVGLSFDGDGSFVAGVTVPDLSKLGVNGLSGAGAVWLSTKDRPAFVPSTIPGFTSTTPFHLREGVHATLSYSLDKTEVA
jgi:hypothetical protein